MAPHGRPGAPERTPDPPSSARFTLSLDSGDVGTFVEISGLAVTVEVEELVEGGQNDFTHRLPRGLKWQNVVLKRGLTDPDVLLPWLAECAGPGVERAQDQGFRMPVRTATIAVHDSLGAPVRSWALEHAFPVRWTGPRFAAGASELASEELEVCHRGLFAAQ
ncbi:phage tail protein [Actinotalea ferrariae]|uniref:phage tail protein n=1 Tax=Actinotalea ferrariae TaxID=1386098 RepID=UPI001C8CC22C|nr:phage tail protein [Actinotalea ferrariae]MBX9243965.1 phage tail protein [Actinotalea ferrariae]